MENLSEDDKRFIKFLLIMQKDDIVELREIAKNDEELMKLVENIINASKDKYLLMYEAKQKLQEMADNTKRAKELKETAIKNLKEGEQKGIKKGVKKGAIKTAKILLTMNMKKEDIARATNLSLQEIENLQ